LTKGDVDRAEKIIVKIKDVNKEEYDRKVNKSNCEQNEASYLQSLRKELEEISAEISNEKKAGVFSLFSSTRYSLRN